MTGFCGLSPFMFVVWIDAVSFDLVSVELSTENVYGSRTEEDADDQRDRDVSDLDIERASDQGNIYDPLQHLTYVRPVIVCLGSLLTCSCWCSTGLPIVSVRLC